MIKIKYCGLKTLGDVNDAIEAGVNAVGFVFVKSSQRFIECDLAASLIEVAKSAGLTTVALFADQDPDEVENIIKITNPDVLQFHGQERAKFCEQFLRPYWKAVPMLTGGKYTDAISSHPNADAYLLDAFGAEQTGGSGKTFEWFKFPAEWHSKLILAGGINEHNVEDAIMNTGTQYLDTSSGIESSPGVKSRFKMMSLAKKIKAISASQTK